jgi:hypothetical protein
MAELMMIIFMSLTQMLMPRSVETFPSVQGNLSKLHLSDPRCALPHHSLYFQTAANISNASQRSYAAASR